MVWPTRIQLQYIIWIIVPNTGYWFFISHIIAVCRKGVQDFRFFCLQYQWILFFANLNALAKSGKLERTPMTRNISGECSSWSTYKDQRSKYGRLRCLREIKYQSIIKDQRSNAYLLNGSSSSFVPTPELEMISLAFRMCFTKCSSLLDYFCDDFMLKFNS